MRNTTPNYATHVRHESLASYARTGLKQQLLDYEINKDSYRASDRYGVSYIHDDIQNGRYNSSYLDLLQTATKQLAPVASVHKPTIKHDVVGCAPSIGRYVQGNPRNMFKRVHNEKPAKTVKIAVSIGASANVTADMIANRAAAILSIINSYEAQGIKTHVDLFDAIPDRANAENCQQCELHTITVKRTNERLALPQLTYICDERLLRGIGFTYTECSPLNKDRAISDNGYGYPQTFEKLAGYDLCFKPVLGRSQGETFSTPQKALQVITAITEYQTTHTTKAA